MNNKTPWLRQAEGDRSPPVLLLYSKEQLNWQQATGKKTEIQVCFSA
jgi:hypothetical protein